MPKFQLIFACLILCAFTDVIGNVVKDNYETDPTGKNVSVLLNASKKKKIQNSY